MQLKAKSKKTTIQQRPADSGLSQGVMHMNGKPLDRGPSKFWDFVTQTFLFLLGGVILCALLYGVITFI